MNMHDSDITARVSRFLDRKSAPRRLDGKPLAQEDEISALCSAVIRNAPRNTDRLAQWWPIFESLLSEECGHGWPTEKEIKEAAKKATDSLPKPAAPTPADEQDAHYGIVATKMLNGNDVSEGYLYGVEAVELLKRGLVTTDILSRYRSNAYFARVRQYGEDTARQWEAERKAAHKSAWDGYDAVQRQRAEKASFNTRPLPYRPDFAA